MYSPKIVDRNIEAYMAKHKITLKPMTVEASLEWKEHLDKLRDEEGDLLRTLNSEEKQIIHNEVALSRLDFRYWSNRYCTIAYDGVEGGGTGLFNFWEAQEIILDHFARIEEENYDAKDQGYPVDGIRVVDHKARQLGGTMFARACGMHRLTLYRDIRAMGASVDEDKILELYNRDKLIWDNLPWWMQPKTGYDVKAEHLSFEALNSAVLYQHSRMQSGLGQGRQFDFGHLTECASWPYPRMIELDFFPTLPQGINTMCILESTAQGRGNWWHEFTEGVRSGHQRGWHYIFVPVYAEQKKYRARVPEGWHPAAMTNKYAHKIIETSEEWLGKVYTPPDEHLYWWEMERDSAVKSGVLNIFLTNYCATPEESFQHTNQSAFPPETLEKLRLDTAVGKPFDFMPTAAGSSLS